MRNDSMRQSMRFTEPPAVAGFGCVAGKKEREGPLYDSFDLTAREKGVYLNGVWIEPPKDGDDDDPE